MTVDATSGCPDHPAALRNVEPIMTELRRLLKGNECVLEVASGTGTHGERCAREFPQLTWQLSEPDTENLQLLIERVQACNLTNLPLPLQLDVMDYQWAQRQFDLVVAINLVHIAPEPVMRQLISGAVECLTESGRLLLYGPYTINHQHTSAGNQDFHQVLQSRNPSWGIRDVSEVSAAAATAGLALTQRIAMPANNQLLVMERASH